MTGVSIDYLSHIGSSNGIQRAIHGIGPNAAQKIITAMKGQNIVFKD